MCKEEVLLLLEQIRESLDTIITRSLSVNAVTDFTHSADGMMRLDSICMQSECATAASTDRLYHHGLERRSFNR